MREHHHGWSLSRGGGATEYKHLGAGHLKTSILAPDLLLTCSVTLGRLFNFLGPPVSSVMGTIITAVMSHRRFEALMN